MNGSIISLIQEKRKLFYRGIIRNSYKDNEQSQTYQSSDTAFSESDSYNANRNFKSRSIQILQEIFSE